MSNVLRIATETNPAEFSLDEAGDDTRVILFNPSNQGNENTDLVGISVEVGTIAGAGLVTVTIRTFPTDNSVVGLELGVLSFSVSNTQQFVLIDPTTLPLLAGPLEVTATITVATATVDGVRVAVLIDDGLISFTSITPAP